MVDSLSVPFGPSRAPRPFVGGFPRRFPGASHPAPARAPRLSRALLRPLL